MTCLKIKNMVCPRCITAVESILHRFNLSIVSVSLGEATVAEDIDGDIRSALGAELDTIGFELLDSPRSIIVGKFYKLTTY